MRIQTKLPKKNQTQLGRKDPMVCFLACFCIIFLFVGEPSYGITTLKFGIFAPQDHPWTEGVKELRDQLELTSKGQVKIEIVPRTEIASPEAFLSKMRGATIDLGLLSTYHMGETVGAMRIFKLPFAFRDRVQAKVVTSGVLAKELLNELKTQKLVGLEFVPSEYSFILHTKQAIVRPEDFKGIKVATAPDATLIATFKALGARPVSIRWGESYHAMSKGVVDAVEGPPSFFFKTKSYEVAKYMSALPIHYIPGIVVASPKTWARIPSDQRNMLSKAITSIVKAIENMLDQRSESDIQKMREMGMAVYYPGDISPFREAVLNVYNDEENKIPTKYWQVAHDCAYVKRDLEVCSRPKMATVFYRRHGDKTYNKYHKVTDTLIRLEYAVWQIRAELAGYIPQQKDFNPYVTRAWRVDFELKKK